MEVDLARGQKTGAFLDQRENRLRVRALARGVAAPRVLNLFSYAGGFSLAAALGGAARVTSVDVAAAAHASAQRTFRANGVDPGAHAFVSADVFAFLDQARARGDRWGPRHLRPAELRPQRQGPPGRHLRLPPAPRRRRRRPGGAGHPLRVLLLQPRDGRGLPRHARRRGARSPALPARAARAARGPPHAPGVAGGAVPRVRGAELAEEHRASATFTEARAGIAEARAGIAEARAGIAEAHAGIA